MESEISEQDWWGFGFNAGFHERLNSRYTPAYIHGYHTGAKAKQEADAIKNQIESEGWKEFEHEHSQR